MMKQFYSVKQTDGSWFTSLAIFLYIKIIIPPPHEYRTGDAPMRALYNNHHTAVT